MKCRNCGKEIAHKLYKTSKNHFCTTSCAASYNNALRPKRTQKDHFCACGNKLSRKDAKVCKICRSTRGTSELVKNTTVGQLKELYKDKSALALAAKIRGYGKTIYDKSGLPKCCIICGYNKHYEVCHIKAIASFPDTATIAEVHSIDNLIALCPNHHWELDHGLL